MKVAVVAPLVTPLAQAEMGGSQAFAADLARALANRGHAITVYCAEGSVLPGMRLSTVPVPEAAARALVMPAGRLAEPVPELRAAFARAYEQVAADRPDAVTQHAFDAEGLELAEGLPMAVVHTLHLPPIVPAVVAAARASRRGLVTVSAAAAAAWAEAGVAARTIRNGVPDFDPGRPAVRADAVVAGRISPEKGTHAAVRMARRAGLTPRLWGTVYDPAYAAANGLVPEGRLHRGDLWGAMAASAVTLMPVEWDEPFGLVAAESQVAGCPVVAYRRGGLPEVVEDGVGGLLVEPGDEEAFVAAIAAARELDRARVRAGARARLLIDRCAAEYEAVLAA